MALGCSAAGTESSLLADLAGYADCSAHALGQSGFGGGLPTGLLTACLTIYVALLGYRMLLGEAFGARAIVTAAVRVGVVVTFCLSWSTFEQVIYRVVIDGPAEIAAGALNGASPSLQEIGARAQRDYETVQFDRGNGAAPLAAPNGAPGQPPLPPGAQPPPGLGQPPATPGPQTLGPRPVTAAGAVFLASAAGGLIAVRLAAGLLLAIGPLIIALGLFDSGLGLVEGWLRALAGATLASAGLLVTSLLELDFVDARVAVPPTDMLSPQGLMTIGIVFSAVSLVMIAATGAAARGVRLPLRIGVDHRGASAFAADGPASIPTTARPSAVAAAPEPASRAQSIADAIAAQSRRERMASVGAPEGGPRRTGLSRPGQGGSETDAVRPAPLGQSLRRAPRARRSASVTRRESRQ
ncbi:type IV secretion system protein [Caulobacter sp. KR2-114]|uniref:type IV secretion system protein n=1 Tax=Caulobacter sp. KR2-114 TaxID=3400912 RepID=UPI003BFD58E5